jgi:hypothetical protein
MSTTQSTRSFASVLWGTIAMLLLGPGCDPGGRDTHGRETARGAIIGGAFTTAAPWVVRIDLSASTMCSGSVLSEHWLLTAAHCVEDEPIVMPNLTVYWADVPGGAQVVYQGQARGYGHEHFDGTANDIALIKLESATGIDLALTGRAKLWGFTTPWTSYNESDRLFTGMGWGLAGNCLANTQGQKRFSVYNLVDRTDPDAQEVNTPTGSEFACPGDSGSPWLFERDGNLIAFAVEAYHAWDLIIIGGNAHGPLIPPKNAWIYETSHNDGLELICGRGGLAGDDVYLECNERRRDPPPPPPPGTLCPSAKQHCCDPNPDGPQCLKCIGNTQECP